jgi:hypothetical protein
MDKWRLVDVNLDGSELDTGGFQWAGYWPQLQRAAAPPSATGQAGGVPAARQPPPSVLEKVKRSCDLGSLLLMLLLLRRWRGRKRMARKGGSVEPRRRRERSRNTE